MEPEEAMRGRVWVAAVALHAAFGCSGGSPVQVIGGGNAITVSVGTGTTPSYSWSGERARSLTVQSTSGEVFWQIEALNLQQGFASPVQHASVPAGARVVVSPRTLQPGVVHTATVVGVDGAQGSRTFTPASLSAP
jgi:hypothetical protein